MTKLKVICAFILIFFILLLSFLLLFFYFINKFSRQAELDFKCLISEIKNHDAKFFRKFDLNNYFLEVLWDDPLVNSYYLFSSKKGLIVFNSKNNFLYKVSDFDEPIVIRSNFFVKKVHITFNIKDEKINLVVYYNILPKSRILYVLGIYLLLTSLISIGFSIYILYLIFKHTNDHDH